MAAVYIKHEACLYVFSFFFQLVHHCYWLAFSRTQVAVTFLRSRQGLHKICEKYLAKAILGGMCVFYVLAARNCPCARRDG